MSSPTASYATTSLARQRHQPPPKVVETLTSMAVSNGSALERMCTFLESERSKLSHLDLQQHWTDLHGVATPLCRQEDLQQQQQRGGDGDAGRHARTLEQMMLDVEAIRSGGYDDSKSTPSGSPRHVHFPRGDDDAVDEDEAVGDGRVHSNNMVQADHSSPLQNNGKSSKERGSKKKAKKEKKEMKKAVKRERKEAKKRLKKESRKRAKR